MAVTFTDKNPSTPTQNIEAWKLCVKLLVGSLSIFFLAGILGYIVIQQHHISLRYAGKFDIPVSLWLSTVALFVVSYAMQKMTTIVKQEHFMLLKRMVLLSIGGAATFTLFQIIGMADVLQSHLLLRSESKVGMDGIAFFLMLFHALHVAIGLIWLGIISRNVLRRRYDHEYHLGLTLCTYYWHFLDFIWVVMFFVFVASNLV